MQTFEEYLISKKIDKDLFRQTEPLRYAEWQDIFGQLNPESFTLQKKFLLNPTRRKYLLIH